MKSRYLTRIDINLPITKPALRALGSLIASFVDADGIKGCTFTAPTMPSPIRGKWSNPDKPGSIEDEDIVWLHACCDLEQHPSLEDTIKFIKQTIETEGKQTLAWITYSSVSQPDF